jgi:RNA polymerase sigma-70 factor (ECF subfamily)
VTNPPIYEFADLVTGQQQRLYRYIVSLLGNADAAWDVLQETNRVLLEKSNQFEPGTSFVNWSLTIAQYQTMAWLRDRKRDRLIATAEIVALLADEAREIDEGDDRRLLALDGCLAELSEQHQQLLHQRYAHSESLAQLSRRSGRSVNAVKQLFFRLRGTLMACIEQRLATE